MAGKPAMDAVTAAITVLEDDPNFNAGKGAVFTHDGRNELDASVMDGATRMAGSIAGVQRIKNPVLLARAVMEKSEHVMMVGAGAEAFAREQGVELVDPSYFRTERRWQQLQKALKEEASGQAHTDLETAKHFGTVGAVALDQQGRLAAGTSTGGMTNKRYGRVGDAPIIGAGTYADAGCAVSGTGWGEFYIRAVAAHAICARMAYLKETPQQAGQAVINQRHPQAGRGWRGHRAGCRRRHRHAVQHRRHVPWLDWRRRRRRTWPCIRMTRCHLFRSLPKKRPRPVQPASTEFPCREPD